MSVINLCKETDYNKYYRKVLKTSEKIQLVVMRINPGSSIKLERHKDIDQFIYIKSGKGILILNGVNQQLNPGSAVIIPAGAWHQVINTSVTDLKLFTIYSPPAHPHNHVQIMNT